MSPKEAKLFGLIDSVIEFPSANEVDENKVNDDDDLPEIDRDHSLKNLPETLRKKVDHIDFKPTTQTDWVFGVNCLVPISSIKIINYTLKSKIFLYIYYIL